MIQLLIILLAVVSGKLVYYQDWDSSNDWTFGNITGVALTSSTWKYGMAYDPINNIYGCVSGWCIGAGLNSLYNFYEASYAISPMINLTSSHTAEVYFNISLSLAPVNDGAQLYWSRNVSGPWNLLGSSWYNGQMFPWPDSPNGPAWVGTNAAWHGLSLNITDLVGGPVYFRFVLRTDYSLQSYGIAIDNFGVTDDLPSSPTPPPTSPSPAPVLYPNETLVYYESFDYGFGGWISGFLPGSGTQSPFQDGIPNYYPMAFCQKGLCLKTGLTDHLYQYTSPLLISPPINLPSSQVTLRFSLQYDISGIGNGLCLLMSYNNSVWQPVGNVGQGYNWFNTPVITNMLAYLEIRSPGWYGSSPLQIVELSFNSTGPNPVQFIFAVISYYSGSESNGAGVLVDEFTITTLKPTVAPTPVGTCVECCSGTSAPIVANLAQSDVLYQKVDNINSYVSMALGFGVFVAFVTFVLIWSEFYIIYLIRTSNVYSVKVEQ